MSLFLLAFAGHPADRGFTGKFAVFRAAIEAGAWPLVVVGAAGQRRRGVLLPAGHRAHVLLAAGRRTARPSASRACPTTIVLAVTATATLVLGIVPGPVLDLAEQAADLRRLMTGARAAVDGHPRPTVWHRIVDPGVDHRPLAARGRPRVDVARRGAGPRRGRRWPTPSAASTPSSARRPAPDGRRRQAVPADARAAGRAARRPDARPR